MTTADFGPDAYEFAQGKPLKLMPGSELLGLLERHGHKAKIDIAAARRLLAEVRRGAQGGDARSGLIHGRTVASRLFPE